MEKKTNETVILANLLKLEEGKQETELPTLIGS